MLAALDGPYMSPLCQIILGVVYLVKRGRQSNRRCESNQPGIGATGSQSCVHVLPPAVLRHGYRVAKLRLAEIDHDSFGVAIMILSGSKILKRLNKGEIFKKGTWDCNSIKEASYALRVAPDGLILEGKQYPPDACFSGQYIEIKPGKIAILSTIERLHMPHDLVGKIGIRLNYAAKGLTGLMGIQVDPCYGRGTKDKRLFIRVVNLGNQSVKLMPGDDAFTFELHEVKGGIYPPSPSKPSTWHRLQRILADQGEGESSWSYATRVESDLSKRFSSEIETVRDSLQPVVMFGVFLVAVTILGVVLSLILGLGDTPDHKVPSWVTSWGWIILFIILSVATLATALVGLAAAFVGGVAVWRVLRSPRG